MPIDTEALTEWLVDRQEQFTTIRQDLTKGTTAYERVTGAQKDIENILSALPHFEVKSRKQPISRIQVGVNVRNFDPQTSWEAAVSQDTSEHRQELYRDIYRVLVTYGPMTDDELRNKFTELGLSKGGHASIAKRRGELVTAGWVRKTLNRRPSNVGAAMTVWAAVPEGS